MSDFNSELAREIRRVAHKLITELEVEFEGDFPSALTTLAVAYCTTGKVCGHSVETLTQGLAVMMDYLDDIEPLLKAKHERMAKN
jgi:hypothetical protein